MSTDLIIAIVAGLFGVITLFIKIHFDNKTRNHAIAERDKETKKELSKRDELLSKRLQNLEHSFTTVELLLENLTGDTDFRNQLRSLIRSKFSQICSAPYKLDQEYKNILLRWESIIEALSFRFYYSSSRVTNDADSLEEELKTYLEVKISEMHYYCNDQVPGHRIISKGYNDTKYNFADFLDTFLIYASLWALVSRLSENHLSDDQVKRVVMKYSNKFINAFITAVNTWNTLNEQKKIE